MKVKMAMVMSLDGMTTAGPYPGTPAWASAEDQAFFNGLKEESDCIIMGRLTFEALKDRLRPDPQKPRLVYTRHADEFTPQYAEPGLEFVGGIPQDVLARAIALDCQNVLLAGGAQTNAAFLNEGLVDEAYLTVEPVLQGGGKKLAEPLGYLTHLRLLDSRQLNDAGTMVMHYVVDKSYMERWT